MSTLFFSPARWKHKARMARLARNLIGGTAIMTANHLDFFLKDYISTALRTINFDLHERYNLRRIEGREISDFGFRISN
jgi:hypothetical protein